MPAKDKPIPPTQEQLDELSRALGAIPSGLFILTAAHEERRDGMLVSWVQQMCFDPPMVSMSLGKGRPIMPLISESRKFGLCQVGESDKRLLRKFGGSNDSEADPFLGVELTQVPGNNVPLIASAMSYLLCDLACHLDVEGDHDLFVGQITRGKLNRKADPKIHIRKSGMRY